MGLKDTTFGNNFIFGGDLNTTLHQKEKKGDPLFMTISKRA